MYASKILGLLIAMILFHSCGNNEKQTTIPELTSIDLVSGIKNQVEDLLLSKIVRDIEIIPLETSEKSLFNYEDITNIISMPSGVLIGAGKRILHFDRQGKYIGDIGKFGNGPQDFYYTRGLGYDEITKEVHVPYNFSTTNEIKTYHLEDGKFLRKTKVVENGVSLIANKNAGEAKEYCFTDGMHVIRRKLPLPNREEEPWQILIKDTQNLAVACIYDPVSLKNLNAVTGMSGTNINQVGTYWGSESPILNLYDGNCSILFEGNDTIYQLNTNKTLSMRFLMNSGNKLSDKEIHQLDKTPQYFNQCLIVKDFLETGHYLYFVVENEEYAYLLQFNKKTGHIESIRNRGELKHSNLMNVHYRVVSAPEFTNDFSGGPRFYPFSHNEHEWIDYYTSEELIESVDQIKQQKILQEDKKEQLLQIIQKMKFDDNPVIFVVKLK